MWAVAVKKCTLRLGKKRMTKSSCVSSHTQILSKDVEWCDNLIPERQRATRNS